MYADMMDGHLPRVLLRLLDKAEACLARNCSAVIAAGQLMGKELRRRWRRQPVVVGNYKRLTDYRSSEERIRQELIDLGFADDVILVTYIANLGRERLIGPLVEAIAGDRRFGLLIGGDGSQRVLARRASEAYPNIRYLGPVAPERVPLLTLCGDVVYYALNPSTPVAAYSSPNKLYEALAAGRAILAGDFGEIARVVSEYDCGILMQQVTAGDVAEALNLLADPSTLRRMQENAARAGREHYNWDTVAGCNLLDVYSNVLQTDLEAGRPARLEQIAVGEAETEVCVAPGKSDDE
jgi:glycosyltransferase involved in cell wall biosynthesis